MQTRLQTQFQNVTIPDTDTASDHFSVAEQCIATLLRKRDGTETSVTGAVASASARNDLDTVDMNAEVDPDETQTAVEPVGKKKCHPKNDG